MSALEAIAMTAVASLVVGLMTQGWALWARVRIEESRAKETRLSAHDQDLTSIRGEISHLSDRMDDLHSDVRWIRDYVLKHGPSSVQPAERTAEDAA
jgi:hypothetical protein